MQNRILGYRRNGCPIFEIRGASPEGDASQGDQPNATTGAADSPSFAPPASQEELDRIITARLNREREKFAGFDDLKAKAAKWDEAEEANRSELEKVQTLAQQEKARADAAELRALRAEVSATKGVPVNLLAGATKEDLEASADQALAWRGEQASAKSIVKTLTPGNGSATDKSVAAGAALFAERHNRTTTKEN